MANQSIYNAFKRMWQHVVAALGNKSDISYVDEKTESLLPIAGGEMTGVLKTSGINLTNKVDYGVSMPSGATNGRLFFVEDNTVDSIVEQGRESGWFYRKWASGKAECWKTVSSTVKVDYWADSGMLSLGSAASLLGAADFGLYWTNTDALRQIQFAFPFQFAEKPTEVVNITQTVGSDSKWTPTFLIAVNQTDNSKTGAYRICTYKKPSNDIVFTLHFYVIGTMA